MPSTLRVRRTRVMASVNHRDCSMDSSSIAILNDRVIVHILSGRGWSRYEDSIEMRDIVQVVIERVAGITHWFLRHRIGWTLHFNDQFKGSEQIVVQLQARLGFTLPHVRDIAGPGGEGTIVWAGASV